ncbi:TetR/AcrR family transcriptional regulator [Mycolicibacterium brumae]|uniref:TetR/AcrR family transcriptional regulator n=1 Tax=Mycolicibacterium brumae TaxID=85968 RepID=A0A2G5P926_9MYCO|nr:TetR/AcrR family transcriptional regulator [Mycolicibacterium brumae]MCV7194087.1 TetR/AcrR family transcriptional regulator [Mycolicibacterium brumae]PIB74404.1 TetR/AcrR family transcriptional regulator [Mycolicibacterium brumae]UWW07453.1 TetR/AcrR family transcriptional regulator [Mycolicibacterium brumae]
MVDGQRRGRWAGVSIKERQARRRGELVSAGIELLGAPHGPALTVRAVCRHAGLTERYFYESFSDRDDFVREIYNEVGGGAMAALASARTPRDAVEQFVALMVDAPARGRVLLLAPSSEPALARSGAAWMPNFIEMLAQRLASLNDPVAQRLAATSLVGGLTALFTEYLDGRLPAERGQFIDYCVEFVTRHAPRET